jgi:hypothetical protein
MDGRKFKVTTKLKKKAHLKDESQHCLYDTEMVILRPIDLKRYLEYPKYITICFTCKNLIYVLQ